MQPLADLLRPQSLDDFIGQAHLVGQGQPLRQLIETKQIFSMIFWGPPGVGKTTLARILARKTEREFIELSAVSAGKADIRQVVEEANSNQRQLGKTYAAPVLFIDEIHRFNKAQQDFLLPFVEKGNVILIGATTENPSFEVISPLLSRTRVFVLKELSESEINQILDKLVKLQQQAKESQDQRTARLSDRLQPLSGDSRDKQVIETRSWLTNYANGDARKLLTIIDNTLQIYDKLTVDNLKKALQSNQLRYDKSGEEHYNTISAFIKSMRASNTDAALYYLARMVDAGEDPKFIA